MSESLRRHVGLEEFTVETVDGVDGQGLPAYTSPVLGEGVLMKEVQVVRNARGEEVTASATLFIDAEDTGAVAEENARVTMTDGSYVGIVVARVDVRQLQSDELDHVTLHLRDE